MNIGTWFTYTVYYTTIISNYLSGIEFSALNNSDFSRVRRENADFRTRSEENLRERLQHFIQMSKPMTNDELKILIQKIEDEHTEFKEAKLQYSFDHLVEYSVALANERGGLLV